MAKYPDIDDNNFYQNISKIYSRYKIPDIKKTLKEICFPTKYEFQIPQKFLAAFINPDTPYKGILVYHRIGAGKTCAAINIAETFKKVKKIIVVLPASIKGGFRSELRSPCTGQQYLSDQERNKLRLLDPSSADYKELIKKSDEKINKYYTIYSYNKFIDLVKMKKIVLRNTLLIIDEIQNMISETGTYYETLYDMIHSAPNDLRLVIMSATPIFDKPIEIALTMNLLIRDRQMPTKMDFYNTFVDTKLTMKDPIYSVKNMDLFKDYVRGYVSYYRGASPVAFPKTEFHFSRTRMSEFQKKIYKSVKSKEKESDIKDYLAANIPNNFFIGVRMISNFVYPNRRLGQEGFDSLKEADLSIENLRIYSPKCIKILHRIKKCEGTVFVYSNFKEFGGIRIFARILEHHYYKNYQHHGAGNRRYAVFSGDENLPYKDEIKAVFNNKNNQDGSRIKVILGTSAVKEGISFLRVQEVHLLEPYWNFSRINQVIGRAIRFCSHKDVPKEKQLVKVYMYLAVHPDIKVSVDEKIMKMAIQKELINLQFEKALKESAIDCKLFKNGNVYPGEDDIVCDV